MHIASGIWYAVAGPTQYLLGSDEVKTYVKADTMYKVPANASMAKSSSPARYCCPTRNHTPETPTALKSRR